jgi:hypothetical protein
MSPVPDLLENIVNVLKEHSLEARLRRVDESPDSFQSDFSVSIDDIGKLDDMKRALKSKDNDLEISFLDSRIV